jgi:hypothetical protein
VRVALNAFSDYVLIPFNETGGFLPDLAGIIQNLHADSVEIEESFRANNPGLNASYFLRALSSIDFLRNFNESPNHAKDIPPGLVPIQDVTITIHCLASVGDITVNNLSAPRNAVISIIVTGSSRPEDDGGDYDFTN